MTIPSASEKEIIYFVNVVLLSVFRPEDFFMQLIFYEFHHLITTHSEVQMKKFNKTRVISFTGYSGSGKTTFIEKLIPELKGRGLNLGLIKHDAHEFDIDKEGKDSFRYKKAGADAVGIFSKTKAAVYGDNAVMLPKGAETLASSADDDIQKTGTAAWEMVSMMPEDLDLIILEGCRDSFVAKIGVSRVETGKGMSVEPEKLAAVITDDPAIKHEYRFGLDDIKKVADFIMQDDIPYTADHSDESEDYPKGISAQQGLEILDKIPLNRQTESIDIYDSFGRVICEDIKALQDFPPFRRSPLDGYAFHSEDTKGAGPDSPVILKVIAEIPAGSNFEGELPKGCAVRLMTGAPVPDGADAVEKYESTEFTDTEVKIFSEFRSDTNVVPKGEDYKAGDVLIAEGTKLDPFCVSVLAMLGKTKVNVYSRPVVTLISTGTELVSAETKELGPGQIRSSSVYTIGGIAQAEGASVTDMGIVKDEASAIAGAIDTASFFSDIIITTGGVSAGDFDLVPAALESIGATILFHKVKMKPGMAFAAATYNGRFILAFSGNPSAAAVTMDVFGRALIRKFQGAKDMFIETVSVKLRKAVNKKSPMGRYVRGTLSIENGLAWFDPSPVSANGITSANCGMDLLGIIPPGGGIAEGETIEAYRF